MLFRSDGRKKKVIECKCRDDGHEHRVAQSVEGGDGEDAEKKCEGNGGCVRMKPAKSNEGDRCDGESGDQISERGSGGVLHG